MNMKKLLFLPLLALSFKAYSYVPAPGPLTLTDPIGSVGAITATLRKNTDLLAEEAHIIKFVQQAGLGAMPYQRIIDHIKLAETPQALLALEAYGKAIMYMYQNKAYVLKAGFLPHCSPIRGVKNPFPNEAELTQLLDEYDQLATIAMGKSYLVGFQMKLAVKSYKYWYWKTCMTIAAATYLLYDIGQRDIKDTTLYNLLHMNLNPILQNIKTGLHIKTSNIKSDQINSDMPTCPEKAIINLMVASQTSRDKLLDKETLSVMSYRNAIKAQMLADEAKNKAIAARQKVSALENTLNNQEITAQKTLEAYYQQKNPEISNDIKVQVPTQNTPPPALSHQAAYESDTMHDQITSLPEAIYEKIISLPASLKAAGYQNIKHAINKYIDPASPNAIL